MAPSALLFDVQRGRGRHGAEPAVRRPVRRRAGEPDRPGLHVDPARPHRREPAGAIPPEVGELPALAHLDLSNNTLTGPIPAGLCRTGSKLETLYLNSNRLEGALTT